MTKLKEMTGLKKAIERIEEMKRVNAEANPALNAVVREMMDCYEECLDILKEEVEKEILAKRLPDGLYNKT